MLDPHRYRLLVATWAVVETSLFGGVMYGWPSLVYIIKEEGLYSHLCTTNSSQNSHSNQNMTSGSNLLYIIESTSPSYVDRTSQTYSEYPNGTHGQYMNKSLKGFTEQYNSTQTCEGFATGSVKCKAQDSIIALGQTISGSVSFIGTLLVGLIHRRIGTKRLRIGIWVLFVFGCLCVAFVTNETAWLIFVGYWTVGVAGLGLLITNIQVSYLFSTTSGTVTSLICGGYDFAGSVMLFIKFAYEAGASLMITHLVLAGASVMTVISAIGWMPSGMFKRNHQATPPGGQDQEQEVQPFKVKDSDREQHQQEENKQLHPSKVGTPGVKIPGVKTYLLSPLYLFHLLWYNILQVRFINFTSLLNPYLTYITRGNTLQVSHFTNVFLYATMFGYVTSCLSGIVYDLQKAKYKASTPLKRSLLPAVVPLSVASLIGVLLSVLIFVPHREVLYAIFVLTTAYRSFLYTMAASFVSQVFPAEHFSILYTVMIISGGVLSFVQYALYYWSYAYEGAYTHMCILMLCMVLLSFLHPVYIVVKCRGSTSVQRHNNSLKHL
ncbi:solute carrier family 43 member 3-like [Haliotis rubra]|uniref:solute carrier family 43 member 3-like n=1 Tax=Haliotis rubra TaxID=36100 RepID=UPI001EE53872|nr:solute carrier family 43 member 3-like [Haliotis rubra]